MSATVSSEERSEKWHSGRLYNRRSFGSKGWAASSSVGMRRLCGLQRGDRLLHANAFGWLIYDGTGSSSSIATLGA